MKKILIGVIVLAAVVVLGGNYYYGQQLEKRLDGTARVLRGMGGDLEYDGTTITPTGKVRINGLRLYAPGFGEPLNIDRVVLRTGGIVGVHELAMDVREQRLPEQLGLSIEGLRLPLGGSYVEQLDTMNPQGGDSFSAAGCGDRSDFSARDLIGMGYAELVVDTHLDYRLVGNGELMELDVDVNTQAMNDLTSTMSFSLGSPSRNVTAVGMAMTRAKLQELRIDYRDRGFADRVIEFCREETGLSRSEFLARHLEAWQDAWKQKGFVAGDNMVDAYRQFLEQPEHFQVHIKPSGELNLGHLAGTSPELMLYQLQMSMAVNQTSAGRVDLTIMDAETQQAWRAERGEGLETSESDTEAPQAPVEAERITGQRAIAVSELRQHRNAQVELRLTNGRTVEGRIRQFEDDVLQLQSFRNGGSVTRPIAYRDIAEAYLK